MVTTLAFWLEGHEFEPHRRQAFFYFFFIKMRQKVKKSVSVLPEGEENIISFISDFSVLQISRLDLT